MRSLFVTEAYPWPSIDGYRLRMDNFVRALGEIGEVEVLCLDGSGASHAAPPEGVGVIHVPAGPDPKVSQWVPKWFRSPLPRRMASRDFDSTREGVRAAMAGRTYDLVVVSHLEVWVQIHELVGTPQILDFDNLENLALAGRRRLGPSQHGAISALDRARRRARWMGMSLVNLADERRWDTQQRAAAEQVARVLVCSEVDVMRSGCENAVVIANGYSLDWKPAAHDTVHDPEHPVLLFVGALGYAPNMDAIGWMATAVMPKILERIPGARLRVVGRNGEAVAQYDSLPGVEIIGHVESLEAELVAADVSVVPIRSGAGTRLKVVEAMANRLPMVSTTLGCEGIDVAHGRELLIGDTDQSFADGVVEMVRNDALRKGLIEAAEARYNEKYRWSTIRHNLATLAKTVVDEAAQA